LINKIEKKISIPIENNQKVILILRNPDSSESLRFIKSLAVNSASHKDNMNMIQSRIDFIDSVLIGIEAENENGSPDSITYLDDGEEKKLTNEIPNWKQFLHPSWKIAASQTLEGQFKTEEQETIKN